MGLDLRDLWTPGASWTPSQITRLAEAYNKRNEAENMRAAFISANIMNVLRTRKRQYTPTELLGIKPKHLSQEEIDATRKYLRETHRLN